MHTAQLAHGPIGRHRPSGRPASQPPVQDNLPTPVPADPVPGRLLLSVAEARALLSVGHTTLYALLARGELKARRLGGRTLVEAASLRAFVAGLPVATFGTPPSAANDCAPRAAGRTRRHGKAVSKPS
ncbi:helix-turn-helix domain-containing protein [Roseococcus sp. DSY-14]|uniref:helix-turn-helix domain-containing protein n=1 Tax=Roseococcus sp. DSY-14 TaxID=3369650 RepID=UPI00387B85D5